ncbi:MAG: HEAT repeat domain-containing protein [Balneolaceae bacterium]
MNVKKILMQLDSTRLPYVYFSILFLSCLLSCTEEEERITLSVTDEDAEIYAGQISDEVSPDLADGLEISLWASENLISDPVALHVDGQGRILVTITERRRNGEIDIRGHSGWMIESSTFETVEDRRDFLHRELAPERSDENSWLADQNEDGSHDWRDLLMYKESVFRVEDLTGNGIANRSELFVRNFNEEVTDVAGAMLYHEGDVFLGVAPDLWRIRDTNGDGYGDQKESISHGYAVNIGFGGHGMSGLTVGPDGHIYWSIGDRGMSVTDQEGKKWHYPREGVIVRAEPDGSNFEVFASGLRNTHEFSFDKYGNLISVDNDGDHAGEHERLVYLVNGSDSGWRVNWQSGKYNDPKNNNYKVLMDEGYFKPRFEDQAAHLLPPLAPYDVGPAGMAYNPGTALNEQWRDHFFVADFVGSPSSSGIHAFTLKEHGASFELEENKQVLEGILATGLDFGPDGSLYFTDWIEGWALKQKGRIWKLDTSGDAGSETRFETRSLLAEGFTELSSDELLELLHYPDMRVRQKAQFELAAKDDTAALQKALTQTGQQLARIHGIWGLAQIGRRNIEAVGPLISLLDDSDSEIRSQAAKMLGDVRYEPAGDILIPLLKDESARVRFFAAEALGRLSWRPAFEAIVKMLEENDDEDVYLRHGGAIALERIGEADRITELSGHPSRAVRIAAVVALKRLEHPGVVRFLDDEDEFIVTNAARAINDDAFIQEGLEPLAKMLEQDRFLNEPLIRRAINATLYVGTGTEAKRLAEFSIREDVPEELRIEALKTLSVWPEPSELDRVTGDPRGKIENDPDDARQAIEPVIAGILADESSDVKIAGLVTVSSLNFDYAIPELLPLLVDDPSPEVRIASLQALADLGYEEIEDAVFTALEDKDQAVRMNALHSIPDLNLAEESIVALITPVLENGTVEERQTALSTLGRIDDSSSYEVLGSQMDLMIAGELTPEVHLDLLLAVEAAGSGSLKERLQEYENGKSRDDSVSVFRELLYGGDAEQGRRVFYQNAAAQCIRCHTVAGNGSNVGPDLTSIGDILSRESLLESMVDPSGRIAPGYGTVTLALQNGETVRGLLRAETENQITVTSGEQETVVDKTEIAERTHTPSGMPAMGEVLSRSEIRDLVEYLISLRGSEE